MGYEEEGSKSQFNAGVALTIRIDSLQKAINAARYNPFAMNPETMTYNWQITLKSLEGLYQEGRPKFSKDEKNECDKIIKVINEFISLFPPVVINTTGRYNDSSQRIDTTAWATIEAAMNKFEQKLREYFDKHNLNSPSIDDYEGL